MKEGKPVRTLSYDPNLAKVWELLVEVVDAQ
jgi:hypothetical protein